MKKIPAIAAVCVLLAAAVFVFKSVAPYDSSEELGPKTSSDQTEENQASLLKEVSLYFELEDGEKLFKSAVFEEGESLLEIMERSGLDMEIENFPPLGEMITSINGFKNGTNGKYWQYWINGEYAQIGASAYIPKPNDKIEWRFFSE